MAALVNAKSRQSAIAGLISWCRSQSSSFDIRENLFTFKVDDATGEVSAVATHDIPADTILVKVPSDLMFGSKCIKRKYRAVYNEIEARVRRYLESVGGMVEDSSENDAEGAPSTVALSFALVLEMLDPESEWKPYFDTLPSQVPNIVDFDGDLSLLEGSVWKDRLGLKKEHMSAIFETVLPPILNKVGVKLGTPDLVAKVKHAYGLWQSRQLKDDIQNRRIQYMVPLLDLVNGEVEKRSNVIVDDGPGSTLTRIELVLKTSRKVEKGEELRQMYDSCSNASYAAWYGFITDAMVYGNPFHRLPLAQATMLADAIKRADAGKDAAEVKASKKALLARLLAGPPEGVNVEITHRNGGFDDAHTLLSAVTKVLHATDADALAALAALPKPPATENPLAGLIKEIETRLTFEDIKVLGPSVLGLIDAHFPAYPNGQTLSADASQLKTTTKKSDMMLLKIRMSDKFLLLCLRSAMGARFGVGSGEPSLLPRYCENCRNFNNLLTCSHCGSAFYCSRACQTSRWKDHKRATQKPAIKATAEDPIAA